MSNHPPWNYSVPAKLGEPNSFNNNNYNSPTKKHQDGHENAFAIEDFCADSLSRSISELKITPPILGRSVEKETLPFLLPPDSDTDNQGSDNDDDDDDESGQSPSSAFVYDKTNENDESNLSSSKEFKNNINNNIDSEYKNDDSGSDSENKMMDSWELIDDESMMNGAGGGGDKKKKKKSNKHTPNEEEEEEEEGFHSPSSSHFEENSLLLNQTCNLRVPLMHVAILVCGTRGDVQPFLIIAQKLKSHGHRIRFGTHALFKDMVLEAGLEFYPLAGDPKILSAHMVETGGRIIPLSADEVKALPEKQSMLNDIMNSTLPACVDLDHDQCNPLPPFRAQAIISNPVTYGHIHVAEYLDVPLHLMFPQPWCPTTFFPHPLSCIRDRRYYFSSSSSTSSSASSFSSSTSSFQESEQSRQGRTAAALSAASSAASSLASAVVSAKESLQGKVSNQEADGTNLDGDVKRSPVLTTSGEGGGGSGLDAQKSLSSSREFQPLEMSKSIDVSHEDLYYDAKVTNWLSYFIADQFVWIGMRSMVNSFRVALQAHQRKEIEQKLFSLRQKAITAQMKLKINNEQDEANETEDDEFGEDLMALEHGVGMNDCCLPSDFLKDWVNTSPMWNSNEVNTDLMQTIDLSDNQFDSHGGSGGGKKFEENDNNINDDSIPPPPLPLPVSSPSTSNTAVGLSQDAKVWVGLDKIRAGEFGANMLNDLKVPFAKMWSPSFVSAPEDYGEHVDVIGNVFPPLINDEELGNFIPPEGLLSWLELEEEKPIFVGFGSMVIKDPSLLVTMIEEAALDAKVRVILQSSWTNLKSSSLKQEEDRIFHIGPCPHEWLFPHVRGVLHHGGAGTVAAGLRAGKPTLVCPFFGDQFFWGMALERARVGLDLGPIAQLNSKKLADGFRRIKSPRMLTRAVLLSKKFAKEDGAENAVEAFYKHLPLDNMICEVSIWLNKPTIATLSMKLNGSIHRYDEEQINIMNNHHGNTSDTDDRSGIIQSDGRLDIEEDHANLLNDPLSDIFGACLPTVPNDRCFPSHSFEASSSSSKSLNELSCVTIIVSEHIFNIACKYKAEHNRKKNNSSSTSSTSSSSMKEVSTSKSGYCLEGINLLDDVELYRSALRWDLPPPKSISAGVYQGTVGFVAKSSQALKEAFVRPFSTAFRAANDSDGGVVSKVVDGVGGFVSGAKRGIPASGRKIKGAFKSLAGRNKKKGLCSFREEVIPRKRMVYNPNDNINPNDDEVMKALDCAMALRIIWLRYFGEEGSVSSEGSKYLPLLMHDLGYGDRAVGDAVSNLSNQWRAGYDLTPSELAACLATIAPPPWAGRICKAYFKAGSHIHSLQSQQEKRSSPPEATPVT